MLRQKEVKRRKTSHHSRTHVWITVRSAAHTLPLIFTNLLPSPRISFQNSQHAVIACPGDFDAKRLFQNVHLVVQGRSSSSSEGLHMLMGHFIPALGWVSQLRREMDRNKVQMRTYLSFKTVSGLFKTSASYVDGAGN